MRAIVPSFAFFIAVMAMLLFLTTEIEIPYDYGLWISVLSIFSILLFSLFGIFEKSIMKYALISVIVQTAYFALDVGTAVLINKSIWFAVIQLINFTIAGALFTLILSSLYLKLKKEKITDYAGLYDKNQFLVLFLAISCLSLGGMPGFNIFVGEFLIYSSLFTIHPILTLTAILAGLVCFIFYFKICYTLFAGKSKTKVPVPLITRIINAILAISVMVLGLIPQILFRILEVYT